MDDSFWSRFGLELILMTFSIFFCYAMYHTHVTYQRRNKKRIDEAFRKAMAQHGIENVEIQQDHTTLGARRKGGKRPFDVHRILHCPPDRWFVYLHVEDTNPVLMPISEQRAMASLNSQGGTE
jgi:catechol-2,3-dioxygenase